MKPPPFDYVAPRSLEEALEIVGEHGWDAKILAGGQSLVPILNFRLAQPAVLVDLNTVPDLAYIGETEKNLTIGAMTRQSTLERDAMVSRRTPLLAEMVPYVAHSQIRNRGTVGGSLAHADPAAELPVWAVARGARFKVQRRGGERHVAAADFYQALMTTDLAPEEILTEVEVPPLAPRTGWGFEEFARRHGDYALMGVAALVTLGDDGRVSAARLVYLSAGEVPMDAAAAAAMLVGEPPSAAALEAAAAHGAGHEIEPTADIHASEAYKRHLARVLGRRALGRAAERAAMESGAEAVA